MEEKLLDTLLQAYINQTEGISSSFSPQFIYNNKDREDPKKVFDCLKENLLQCKEFAFSVAFINDSGLNLLKQVLYELKNRFPQVKGRIITSNYLGFTEPKALHDLEKYDNIQVRMYYVSLDDKIGFHTKGYIFRFDNDDYKAVIGSSNITQSALTLNNEWNNLIVSKKEGKVMQNILSEYERMWKASLPLEEILSQYEQEYLVKKERRQVEETEKKGILAPNAMQQTFIKRLNDSISKKEKRGLLISATGTGKTYASAFGIRSIKEFKVNKILFVTHRETILSQAMETYKKVFQSEHKMALFSGTNHEIDGADFIFSTINTISDEKYYSQFKREEFDIVVIDECHRIGRETMYQKILSYFKPKYLLGMSATPDRNDGFDVYDVFDHNILYEIRLEDALEANMLVPFHYFGISDLSLQGQKQEIEDVRFLASEERVKLILSNSEYYGYSGERLKCLVFVSSIEEGVELEKKILAHGVKCRFLSGKDSSMERERCISLLEEEDASKNHLDMILTRDIFNEGVDIPSVNQVIFLRPTQSSIVFIQQLGRGLRLNKGKEYLTVIDFIANYESNYIIPQTFERKGAGQKRGERAIHPLTYGESVIQFDEVSTKRIIESYSKATNTDKKRIREQYHQIKSRLGRIPSLIEFDAQGSLSGRSFLDFYTHGYRSYYEFLFSEGEEKNHLSEVQRDTLIYASMAFGAGLRIYEPSLLKCLCSGKKEIDFTKGLNSKYIYDEVIRNSMFSILHLDFYKKKDWKIKAVPICERIDDEFVLAKEFLSLYQDETFKKYFDEIVSYSLYSNERYFSKVEYSRNPFVLYEKYTRRDVCYLINNLKNEEGTVNGYKIFKDPLNVIPIFVTYQKNFEEKDSLNYEDSFLNPNLFCWDSRNQRTLQSQEIKDILNIFHNPKGRVYLFVKRSNVVNRSMESKDKDDDRSFYFLGEVSLLEEPKEGKKKDGQNVVKFIFRMKNTVREDIYQYLVSSPLILD